jgi:predicted nuclease of predicted toxin-antitoxin system
MANVPVKGIEDSTFQIKAQVINKNGYNVPVFEVKIAKNIILFDQDKDFVEQENETVSVDGVNGPEIVLGSLTNVSTNGNWPTIFDAPRQ